MKDFYWNKVLNGSFSTVKKNVEDALKTEGFGVVSEIDMQSKLSEKLNVNIKPYTILGVCNPKFAWEAIQAEENIGIFLPCKVLLKQTDDNKVDVVFLNPDAPMQLLNNEKLNKVSKTVTQMLKNSFDSI